MRQLYTVTNRTTNSPPGAPTHGDTYLIGPSPSGGWSGKSGIARYLFGQWFYFPLQAGDRVYDLNERRPLTYSGSALTDEGVSSAQMFTLSFTSSTATGVNTRTTGLNSTTSSSSINGFKVPSGKTLKVLQALASIESGTTDGTYTVDLLLYNLTDSSMLVIGTLTVVVSGGTSQIMEYSNLTGTIDSPLQSLATGKRFVIGWINKNTSPGALTGNLKNMSLVCAFV